MTRTRSVIVGGFASNGPQVGRVAEGITQVYGTDTEGMSFRDAMNDRTKLESFTRGARVFTHSAGMLAIKNTMPKEIIAIAPPITLDKHRLVAFAALSTCELTVGSCGSPNRFWEMFERYGREIVAELSRHPRGNFGQLARISEFNALDSGVDAVRAGIPTSVAFMDRDRFFHPTPNVLERVSALGVRILTLTGGHEALLCKPVPTVGEFKVMTERHRSARLDRNEP